MRRQNVQQVFSIRYDSLWNPELSLLPEALGIQLSLQNFYWSLQLTHVRAESSAAKDEAANVHLLQSDVTWVGYLDR